MLNKHYLIKLAWFLKFHLRVIKAAIQMVVKELSFSVSIKLNVIKLDCPHSTLRVGFCSLCAIEHDGDFADELSPEQM